MDKKLEARVARLEKMLSKLSSRNEDMARIDWDAAREAVQNAISSIKKYSEIVDDGGGHNKRYLLGLESDARLALNAILNQTKYYRNGSDGFHID